MEFVTVEHTEYGKVFDPTAYLERLPELARSLPSGARAFAEDPEHYDFFGKRCVKDLKPLSMATGDTDGRRWVELQLRHNCWKHEDDLTIRYTGVRSVVVEPDHGPVDVTHLRDVRLDEVVPHEVGCRHEIACLAGSVTVVCEDLTATWFEADCTER
jgi:hypothetical protein